MRLDDVADAEAVDVALVPTGKLGRGESVFAALALGCLSSTYGSGGLFTADLAQSVRVLWVDVVVLFQRKRVVVRVSLSKADAVRRLAARNQDLLDAQFACYNSDDLRDVSRHRYSAGNRNVPASMTLYVDLTFAWNSSSSGTSRLQG